MSVTSDFYTLMTSTALAMHVESGRRTSFEVNTRVDARLELVVVSPRGTTRDSYYAASYVLARGLQMTHVAMTDEIRMHSDRWSIRLLRNDRAPRRTRWTVDCSSVSRDGHPIQARGRGGSLIECLRHVFELVTRPMERTDDAQG